jgi:hypothetical protein
VSKLADDCFSISSYPKPKQSAKSMAAYDRERADIHSGNAGLSQAIGQCLQLTLLLYTMDCNQVDDPYKIQEEDEQGEQTDSFNECLKKTGS